MNKEALRRKGKMTKWLLALVLAVSATTARAQDQDPDFYQFRLPCGTFEPLLRVLADKQELLLFTGSGAIIADDGMMYQGASMVFVNPDTGSWSYVMRFTETFACLLTSGQEFSPYDGTVPTNDKL